MPDSLQGRDVPRKFIISLQSGNVTLVVVLKEPTDSRARMCIGSGFQALGPTTANARVPYEYMSNFIRQWQK